jgi:hypothetical protein
VSESNGAAYDAYADLVNAWHELSEWIRLGNSTLPRDIHALVDAAHLSAVGRAIEALDAPMTIAEAADHVAEGREAVADEAADMIEAWTKTLDDGAVVDTEALAALAERVRALGSS